jgi:hypothetical protein
MKSKFVLPKPTLMNHHHWNLLKTSSLYIFIFSQWRIVNIFGILFICVYVFLFGKNGYV